MLDNLWFDLKYAWRLALKTPGHFLLCTVVVALSVGLALFSYVLARTLLMTPLPFNGGERWLSVQIAPNKTAQSVPDLDAYTYQEILKRTRTTQQLGSLSSRQAVLSEGEASNSLRAAIVSPGLLAGMQTAPHMGRLFDPADARLGAAPTAILSYDSWQNYFAADPAIVGKQARIDGRPVQIIGVMPRDFFVLFNDFELLFPLQPKTLAKPSDKADTVEAFVKLTGEQKPDTLLAEMQPAVDDVNRNYPHLFDGGRHLELIPAHLINGHVYVPYVALVSFIAIAVLLLGCVNISLVFFARFLERSRELALRSALGSSRLRLLRQCLLDTVFIVVLGLAFGIGFVELAVRWARGIGDTMMEALDLGRDTNPVTMHPDALMAGILIATLVWLLSTLIPAWRISKQDATVSLNGGGKGALGSDRARSVGMLVGLQVIVSCLVLVICMCMQFAIREETSKPNGIESAGVILSTYPTIFGDRYPDLAARRVYWDNLTAGIKTRVPGAEVAYATEIPTRAAASPVSIENRERSSGEGTLKLPLTVVSDNYFSVLGIKLRSGRLFDGTDDGSSLTVAVIDEVTARRYWPGQDALGKRVQVDPADGGPWLTVVGVVSSVGHEPYGDDLGVLYRPLRQADAGAFLLLAKLPALSQQGRHVLRSVAFAIDQDLPLHNLQMLRGYLVALDVTFTGLAPIFGVIASLTVILAASGLFGLISRSVARRTQEIGLRRALGGTPGRIIGLFLRPGIAYLGVGIIGGGLGAVVANQLSQQIPNILAHAVPVIAGVFLTIAVVIFIASYLPSRRAVALEPADALRYE
jgi:predicted permease